MAEIQRVNAFQPRLFTVGEFHSMARAGILHPDEQVELVSGQIIAMPPQGPAHAGTLRKVVKYLRSVLPASEADVSSAELPVVLSEYDEPIPDVAVLRPDPSGRDYYDRHPGPADVLLIVEVAVTSLEYDRTIKRALYAQAGICEYWIVAVPERRLWRFTEPGEAGYRSEVILTEADALFSVAFPGLALSVGELFFPPV